MSGDSLSLIDRVKTELINKRGFIAASRKQTLETGQNYLIIDPEVQTVYGPSLNKKNSLVVKKAGAADVRVFVFDQNVSGSADEKLPFMYLSGLQAQESCVIFVVNGEGLRKCAYDWLKNAISNKLYQVDASKKIWLKSFEEFSLWLESTPKTTNKDAAIGNKPKPRPKKSKAKRAFSFVTENKYSKHAVELVESMLVTSYGRNAVSNVENDPTYQAEDVDLVLTLEGEAIKIEVKSDKHYDTGNVALEIFSNYERNTPGWVYSSKADFLYYAFPDIKTAYFLKMVDLKAWVDKNIDNQKLKFVQTYIKGGTAKYSTAFIAVPIATLLKEISNSQKIDLP